MHTLFSRDDHTRLYQVRRRLSDLRAAKLIDRGEKRDKEVEWWAV